MWHRVPVAMVIGCWDPWPCPPGVPGADLEGADAPGEPAREEMVVMMFWTSGRAWQAGLMWWPGDVIAGRRYSPGRAGSRR